MFNWINKRTRRFKRNNELDQYLEELTDILCSAENQLPVSKRNADCPVVFIVGPPRAGTTLLMQVIAQSGCFTYPTNFLSRFYGALEIGYKIQRILFDGQLQYRDELNLNQQPLDFESDLGKTTGALSPNVFWYFWYHHFQFGELSYLSKDQFHRSNTERFKHELARLYAVSSQPIAMKAMIINWNVLDFAGLLPNAVFLRVKRETPYVANSIYEARKTVMGSYANWWSFKPPEFDQLKSLSPKEQVAGQCLSIEYALDEAFSKLKSTQKLECHYEKICKNPQGFIDELCQLMNAEDTDTNKVTYPRFSMSNSMDKALEDEWQTHLNQVASKVSFASK
ncbi:sulfotransferase [Aliikangiella marina]|uniref:Sulfotransferase n=1 Tax=Aliikangiella marina TaxID=1712262 RepID=A0A545TDQ5_9GAMM|nr:sulfotransferase [Aliikangiella marina]TQV75321.1 sulfotransferase [Aliikangiella marina]